MTKRKLYPPIEPYDSGYLDVGDQHSLYYEQSGNPDGKPAVFLHGGPGGGGDTNARRFFNPEAYRIVVFDQRGAGRSRPHASLHANTTGHLIEDIERIRQLLGIQQWLVFGGSWGSTLALAYAQAYPASVSELVLRGIFLLRKHEIDWFYQAGASRLFPDRWQDFLEPIPQRERADLLSAYYRRLIGEDAAVAARAARAWSIWEGATSSLLPNDRLVGTFSGEAFSIALAKIEAHYFVNRGFLGSDNQLIDSIDRIRHIPCAIVQGRYDVVCPMQSAWELHTAWPESELFIVVDAGHSAYEPGNTSQLIELTDKFALAPAQNR